MARRRAMRRSRHSQGRATSSGPRIQPEPSQTPSGQAGCAASSAPRQPDGSRRRAHASSARSTSGGPSPALCSTGRSAAARPCPRTAGTARGRPPATSPGGPVAVLGDDQLRLAGIGVLVVLRVAVDEGDDVRVLLDRPAFAKVGEDRPLVGPQLGRARELRDADHRHVQLAGEDLQAAADLADLLDPVDARVLGPHQLHVVDDHEAEAALAGGQAPRLGAQLEQAEVGGVVEPQRRLLELVAGAHDPRPVALRDLALAQPVAGDPRPAGDEAVRELGLGHLEREEGDRHARALAATFSAMLQTSADFPSDGPGGEHDQVAGLEAAEQVVEVAEAGRRAR